MSAGLHELTLAAGLRAIARGECRAEEIARACLERIAAREPVVRAWECRADPEDVLAHVRAATGTPLAGLLWGIKDNIDTADLPTAYGTPRYAGRRPAADAACVAALRRAGATVAGKTVTTEFAYFTPAATANPCDPARTPGGSSSGSAAAVADGMVPVALGTQTVGSVIRPAAFCGCCAYVASRGALPLAGVRALAPSFDTLGVLARSVTDLQIARAALVGRPAAGEAPACPSRPRLGLYDGGGAGPIEPEQRAALERVAARLEAAGADVRPVSLAGAVAELADAHEVILAYEAARELAGELEPDDGPHTALRELIARGLDVGDGEYAAAHARLRAAAARIAPALSGVDAILAPAAPGPAPPRDTTGSPHVSRPWQAIGRPAVALPATRTAAGLPLGVQLIGRHGDDDRLLALAAWAAARLDLSAAAPVDAGAPHGRPAGSEPRLRA